MGLREDFLLLAEKYQELTGDSESAVSNKVLQNGTRLAAIRQGAAMTTWVAERGVQWFTGNWPKGHRDAWPKGVRRIAVTVAIPSPAERKGHEGAGDDVEP